MGNCGSSPEEEEGSASPAGRGHASSQLPAEEEKQRRSSALDKELREHQKRIATEIKILLLGKFHLFTYAMENLA